MLPKSNQEGLKTGNAYSATMTNSKDRTTIPEQLGKLIDSLDKLKDSGDKLKSLCEATIALPHEKDHRLDTTGLNYETRKPSTYNQQQDESRYESGYESEGAEYNEALDKKLDKIKYASEYYEAEPIYENLDQDYQSPPITQYKLDKTTGKVTEL